VDQAEIDIFESTHMQQQSLIQEVDHPADHVNLVGSHNNRELDHVGLDLRSLLDKVNASCCFDESKRAELNGEA
jgi:hypothetical protein